MVSRITVLIAAFNAEAMIIRAIRSALTDPRTAEVIVVDDASDDRTMQVVTAEEKRDPRVRLIAQTVNTGPAAARNRGLDAARGSHVAVLDADDFFLPGRLDLLNDAEDYALVADNVVFTNFDQVDTVHAKDWAPNSPTFENLDLAAFVAGNLKHSGPARGELGFLKPLMSLDVLNAYGLRYDETLRLGEDYDLYVRMMLAGGRMKLTLRPGYCAVLRSNSLSAQHSTDALGRFAGALARHLDAPELAPDVRSAMRRHLRQVRAKWAHRHFLDLRHTAGPGAAIRFAAASPDRLAAITAGIARDKLGLSADAGAQLPASGYRLLRNPNA